MDLKGTASIVTGGGSGIGLAISKMLVSRGADVWICGRNIQKLEEARKSFTHPQRCHPVTCDVSQHESVRNLFRPFQLENRPIRVLVNAAGILRTAKVEDTTFEMMDSVFKTNFYGAVYCCQEALPLMKAHGSGYIINICSVAGIRGMDENSAYSSSKFALRGFSQSLHQEVKGHGIKVTTICPGYTWTAMVQDAEIPKEDMIQADDVAKVIEGVIDLSKNAVVTELVIDRLTTPIV